MKLLSLQRSIFKRQLLLTGLLLLLAGCAYTSGIKVIDKTEIQGRVSGLFSTPLPSEAKLHVLLHQVSSDATSGKIIAEQTLAINRFSSIYAYQLSVPTEEIHPDEKYIVQACVTVSGSLRMQSSTNIISFSKNTAGFKDIELKPFWQSTDDHSFILWIEEDETTLQNSIQSNLGGTCNNSASNYEIFNVVNASDILPPEIREGSHHKVYEQVTLRGPHYLFKVDSDYGQFSAQGLPMLRRLILEISAITTMETIEKSDEFATAFSDEALSPFGEFKEFILNPIDRLSGAAKGVGKFIASTSASLTQKRSHYEDRYLEALVSVSKYKRRFAYQMGIDVYTGNAEVQRHLNRISWAAALGSWVPSVMLIPLTGPAKLTYSVYNWEETLNQLMVEESPDSLRFRNKQSLKSIGVSEGSIDRFLSHSYYSPRHHSIITQALASMTGVTGLDLFLGEILVAETDVDALSFQQLIEFFSAYHQFQEPLEEIILHKGLAVAYTANKNLIMLLPIDIGRWTPFAESLFEGFGKELVERPLGEKKLWLSGTATDTFKRNMAIQGVVLTENATKILKLID